MGIGLKRRDVFAFVGFDAIPQISNEFHFSAKSASIIAIISLLMASVMYNLLNINKYTLTYNISGVII